MSSADSSTPTKRSAADAAHAISPYASKLPNLASPAKDTLSEGDANGDRFLLKQITTGGESDPTHIKALRVYLKRVQTKAQHANRAMKSETLFQDGCQISSLTDFVDRFVEKHSDLTFSELKTVNLRKGNGAWKLFHVATNIPPHFRIREDLRSPEVLTRLCDEQNDQLGKRIEKVKRDGHVDIVTGEIKKSGPFLAYTTEMDEGEQNHTVVIYRGVVRKDLDAHPRYIKKGTVIKDVYSDSQAAFKEGSKPPWKVASLFKGIEGGPFSRAFPTWRDAHFKQRILKIKTTIASELKELNRGKGMGEEVEELSSIKKEKNKVKLVSARTAFKKSWRTRRKASQSSCEAGFFACQAASLSRKRCFSR